MKAGLVLALCLAVLGCAHSATLRVTDGTEVAKHSIPYQAHIQLTTDFGQSWNCTGVLVSENYVLTTSKCQWSGATHATVLLGAHNITEAETSQQSFPTKNAWKIYNKNFTYETLENNIAFVKLPSPATLNEYVQVAKLAASDDVEVGQNATISGWGGPAGRKEHVLLAISTSIVENSVCASSYEDFYTGEKTICVKAENGDSACYGDGGAPLVIDGVVVGIFSGGPIYTAKYNCQNQPNIFTKVASYLDWIKENSDIN